jgi:hypothetical protein
MDIIDTDGKYQHLQPSEASDIQLCLGGLHPGVLQRLTIGKFGAFIKGFQHEKW